GHHDLVGLLHVAVNGLRNRVILRARPRFAPHHRALVIDGAGLRHLLVVRDGALLLLRAHLDHFAGAGLGGVFRTPHDLRTGRTAGGPTAAVSATTGSTASHPAAAIAAAAATPTPAASTGFHVDLRGCDERHDCQCRPQHFLQTH